MHTCAKRMLPRSTHQNTENILNAPSGRAPDWVLNNYVQQYTSVVDMDTLWTTIWVTMGNLGLYFRLRPLVRDSGGASQCFELSLTIRRPCVGVRILFESQQRVVRRQGYLGSQCSLSHRVQVVIQLSPVVRTIGGSLLSCNSGTSKLWRLHDALGRGQ